MRKCELKLQNDYTNIANLRIKTSIWENKTIKKESISQSIDVWLKTMGSDLKVKTIQENRIEFTESNDYRAIWSIDSTGIYLILQKYEECLILVEYDDNIIRKEHNPIPCNIKF